MVGRGRGRGRGGSSSFTREQLDYIRDGSHNEPLAAPVTQPPPLYPLLDQKPAPLVATKEANYMLILKQDFLEHMQYKSTYLNLPQEQKEPELEIDKLLAQLPKMQESCTFDWRILPKELRSKIAAKRNRQKQLKNVDLEQRFTQLEKLENKTGGEKKIKTENVEMEEEEEELDEEQDEEMDEGTDYVNNYFDNGEAYEDEDDNLDDGPIY